MTNLRDKGEWNHESSGFPRVFPRGFFHRGGGATARQSDLFTQNLRAPLWCDYGSDRPRVFDL